MGERWLKQTLAGGISTLMLLRLRNAPPEDAITATLQAWYKVITHKRQWDEQLDRQRLESAFMYLAQTYDQFPTPKQLLEAMPPRKLKELPPPTLTEEQRQKNQQRIRQLLEQMKKGMVCKK
ncbi:hypothetical protein ROV31_05995 [Pasteurella multocida]|uniref:hypothetical protein n=1 Tax=Pasteurella multocida TaxID=747 RepID=UPI002CC98CB8|nr:hypothetical protein [Pasteurella multocida]MEB3470125.1 hypothetical protein [Pasteurella multocida]